MFLTATDLHASSKTKRVRQKGSSCLTRDIKSLFIKREEIVKLNAQRRNDSNLWSEYKFP